MSSPEHPVDWSRTTFDGSRREQLRQALAMTVRQRLEALDQLTALSQRLQAMPKQGVKPDMVSSARERPVAYRGAPEMNDIVLEGCTPTPLANYLKALAVLRLLSRKDPKVRGYWRGDRFVLRTALDRGEIEQFFLNDYAPTPLVGPWAARSGFYEGASEGTAREALAQIESSDNEQLEHFRKMIASVRALLRRHRITEKPSGEKKTELLRICRAELPDPLLEWLDACYVLSGEQSRFPPLLGTGGNEGSGSYVSGFAQQVVVCIADRAHDSALTAALFGIVMPKASEDQTPGHFSPAHGGGLNSSTGFKDDRASVNPWDFILALEGTLTFAGAAVRRGADDPVGIMSYPFTVHAVSAGAGSLAEGDRRNKPRGELWLPLWVQPSTYAEVRSLTAEGRIALGRRPARDGLDFMRAVHRLGAYRGVRSFQRFGLLNRKGDAYFATPLSRVAVSDKVTSDLLDELDQQQWLDRFRRFASGGNTANRFIALRKQLEDRIFDLSGRRLNPAEAQSLLVLLGEIQSAVSSSRTGRDAVRPIPRLSEKWIAAADDGTAPFRIAKALAGLRGVGDEPLPLRSQWFPVQRERNQWITPDADENLRIFLGQRGRLTETLTTLLQRRLWLARRLEMKDKPFDSPAGAPLDDLIIFLRDDRMDARIAALLPCMCLCEIPRDAERSAGDGVAPAAFALLKLALTPDHVLRSLGRLVEQERLPVAMGMVEQLASGHPGRAVENAWRRLHASGLAPAFAVDSLPDLRDIDPLRAAAALLIPLTFGATASLGRQALNALEPGPQT